MTVTQTPTPIPDRARRGLHRLAVAAAVCTLWLIFVGATVTSNDAGLAVPDWPTTFGENMFLYSPSHWVGDVFFEHSHRLTGAAVGLLVIALTALAHFRDSRMRVRVFGWVLLGAVIVQGVMGGLRVTEINTTLAIIHGCFAQLFLAGTVCMALVTSRSWIETTDRATSASRFWKFATTGNALIIFCQLIAGAIYRHRGVGLAWHIVGAVCVTTSISVIVMWITGEHSTQPTLVRFARWIGGLLVVQLALGVGAYVAAIAAKPDQPTRFLAWTIPSLHVAVGAMIFALSVGLTLAVLQGTTSIQSRTSTDHKTDSSGVTTA